MVLETLQKEMIAAMKAKNKLRKDAISSLIGAIKKAAIDEKCRDTISDELANKVILKEKKTMQDMIDTCPAEREDLLNEYISKMSVIEEFVPEMMNESEIREAIFEIFDYSDAPTSVGEAMKIVMHSLKGKADGKLINKVVREIINNGK